MGTGRQGTVIGSEKMRGRVDEEDQMMRRKERTGGTSIKTPYACDIEQPATFFAWPILPVRAAFLEASIPLPYVDCVYHSHVV